MSRTSGQARGIREGDRVIARDGRTGTVASGITYRTTAGRSHKQVRVSWDGGGEWDILLRNLTRLPQDS
jgi:hypothetical protein